MILKRFFAVQGLYPAYRLFSRAHFLLLFITSAMVALALWRGRHMDKKDVLHTIRSCTIFLWLAETIKIVYNLLTGHADAPQHYVPLYYCSLILYCGGFAGFGKGVLKHVGDVFIAVGGIIGGGLYLLSPNTSAGMYPAFHFITMHSFIHHGIMVYLGILLLRTGYIHLKRSDLRYYAAVICVTAFIAFIANIILDSNLMFVSKNFPGTPIAILYAISPSLFPVLITFVQAVPPFYVVYALHNRLWKKSISLDKETNI